MLHVGHILLFKKISNVTCLSHLVILKDFKCYTFVTSCYSKRFQMLHVCHILLFSKISNVTRLSHLVILKDLNGTRLSHLVILKDFKCYTFVTSCYSKRFQMLHVCHILLFSKISNVTRLSHLVILKDLNGTRLSHLVILKDFKCYRFVTSCYSKRCQMLHVCHILLF